MKHLFISTSDGDRRAIETRAIKSALRLAGWQQADIADECESRENFDVSQSTISRILAGRTERPPKPEILRVFSALLQENYGDRWIRDMAGATAEDDATDSATAAPPPPPPKVDIASGVEKVKRFCLDVVESSRAAFASDDSSRRISEPCSPRGSFQMQTAYIAFRRTLKLDDLQAAAVAFNFAFLARADAGMRHFLQEAFYSKFSRDAEWVADVSHMKVNPTDHPMLPYVESLLPFRLPLWLSGHKGSGKTTIAETAAMRFASGFRLISACEDMPRTDIFGKMGAIDGTTVKEYGPLPLSIIENIPCIIDEISTLETAVQMGMNDMCNRMKSLTLDMFGGEILKIGDRFALIATDNSIGLGEAYDYVGTMKVNAAFRDRFIFIPVDYIDRLTESLWYDAHIARIIDAGS